MSDVLQEHDSWVERSDYTPPAEPTYWAQPVPASTPAPRARLGVLNILALVVAFAGLVLDWVTFAKLHVRGVHVGQGKFFAFVLVVAVAVSAWRATTGNRAASQVLSAVWIVVLAVALYELMHVSGAPAHNGKHFGAGIGLLVCTLAAAVGSVGSSIDAVRVSEQANRGRRVLATVALGLLVVGTSAFAGAHNKSYPLTLAVAHHRGAGLHGLFGGLAPSTLSTPSTTSAPSPTANSGNTGDTGNTGTTGSGPAATTATSAPSVVSGKGVTPSLTTSRRARRAHKAHLGRTGLHQHHRFRRGAGLHR